MNNLIIYGPPGIGKYTYALNKIKTVSPSNLKYEKKITFTYNKSTLYFKISDIHYEVDMSLLGCNSKLLWYEIYNQITDIISAKNVKTGIILCKYFNEIHNELLEIFYSYMQSQYNSGIIIKFIILTSDISFLPDNINNCCEKIILSRPSKSSYNKILKSSLDKDYNINKINTICRTARNSIFIISTSPYTTTSSSCIVYLFPEITIPELNSLEIFIIVNHSGFDISWSVSDSSNRWHECFIHFQTLNPTLSCGCTC